MVSFTIPLVNDTVVVLWYGDGIIITHIHIPLYLPVTLRYEYLVVSKKHGTMSKKYGFCTFN